MGMRNKERAAWARGGLEAGDLVAFSNRQLSFDFEALQGQTGLLVGFLRDGPYGRPGWHVYWPMGNTIFVYTEDLERIE